MERKRLTDILSQGNGGGNWIDGNWGDTAPAPEFGPIPSGSYEAHLIEKLPFNAKTGTPGIKLTFSILDGPFKGRRLWFDIWLTDQAKPQALRDFAKLGIRNKAQIEMPLPADKRIRCRLIVGLSKSDTTGDLYNVIKRFEPIGVDDVEVDPFAPPTNGGPQ